MSCSPAAGCRRLTARALASALSAAPPASLSLDPAAAGVTLNASVPAVLSYTGPLSISTSVVSFPLVLLVACTACAHKCLRVRVCPAAYSSTGAVCLPLTLLVACLNLPTEHCSTRNRLLAALLLLHKQAQHEYPACAHSQQQGVSTRTSQPSRTKHTWQASLVGCVPLAGCPATSRPSQTRRPQTCSAGTAQWRARQSPPPPMPHSCEADVIRVRYIDCRLGSPGRS